MLYDQLVSELTARGNTYAAYLRDGRPADFWSLSNGDQAYAALGYQEQLADISVPSTPAQPVAAHPPVQQQANPAQQSVVWQQVDAPNPATGLVFHRTANSAERVEAVAPAVPVAPTPAPMAEDGLVATQPMAAAELPQRRPLGGGPMMQAGWAAQVPLPPRPQASATPAGVEGLTHTPFMTPVPPYGSQSPVERGAQIWGGITQE